MLKEEKAQVSLEYLLILGGAVVVATIVTLVMKMMARNTVNVFQNKQHNVLNNMGG